MPGILVGMIVQKKVLMVNLFFLDLLLFSWSRLKKKSEYPICKRIASKLNIKLQVQTNLPEHNSVNEYAYQVI